MFQPPAVLDSLHLLELSGASVPGTRPRVGQRLSKASISVTPVLVKQVAQGAWLDAQETRRLRPVPRRPLERFTEEPRLHSPEVRVQAEPRPDHHRRRRVVAAADRLREPLREHGGGRLRRPPPPPHPFPLPPPSPPLHPP